MTRIRQLTPTFWGCWGSLRLESRRPLHCNAQFLAFTNRWLEAAFREGGEGVLEAAGRRQLCCWRGPLFHDVLFSSSLYVVLVFSTQIAEQGSRQGVTTFYENPSVRHPEYYYINYCTIIRAFYYSSKNRLLGGYFFLLHCRMISYEGMYHCHLYPTI